MSVKELFKLNLKRLRFQQNLTQTAVADTMDIDRARYAYWEHGKSEPSLTMLVSLAKALNISVDDLLTKEL